MNGPSDGQGTQASKKSGTPRPPRPGIGRPDGNPNAPPPLPRGRDNIRIPKAFRRRHLGLYESLAKEEGAASPASRPQPARAGKATRPPHTYSRSAQTPSLGQCGPWAFRQKARHGKGPAIIGRRGDTQRALRNDLSRKILKCSGISVGLITVGNSGGQLFLGDIGVAHY